MMSKLLGLAVALALPTLLAAQTPTIPATRATRAVPAHKGGQSGNHRP